MKHLITILTVFFLSQTLSFRINAQKNSNTHQTKDDSLKTANKCCNQNDTVFFEIPDTGIYKDAFIHWEEYPKFAGGEIAVTSYILENTVYPQLAIKDSIEGRVIVRFSIEIDGSLNDIQVVRGIRTDIDNECIRVIKEMPDWKPGSSIKKSNKGWYRTNFKFWYSIPITFSLSNHENKKGIIIRPK